MTEKQSRGTGDDIPNFGVVDESSNSDSWVYFDEDDSGWKRALSIFKGFHIRLAGGDIFFSPEEMSGQ